MKVRFGTAFAIGLLATVFAAVAYGQPITSYPYLQDFDSWTTSTRTSATIAVTLEDGWTNDTTDDGADWRIATGTTPSGGTGPNAAHGGSGNYIHYEDSDSPSSSTDEVRALTPEFDLSAGINLPELSFWVNANNGTASNGDNELHIDIINVTTSTTDVDVIPFIGHIPGTGWTNFTVDLSPYVGNTIQVMFRIVEASVSTGFAHDICVDTVEVTGVPDGATIEGTAFSGQARIGDTDIPVSAFDVFVFGPAQDFSSLAVTYTGSVGTAEISNIKLWDDANDNGVVDTGESQLGSTVAALASGQAVFTGAPLFSVPSNTSANLLLTADVGSGATGNQAVSFEVTAASDVAVSPGPDNSQYPVDGGSTQTVEFTSTLPVFHDFGTGAVASNQSFEFAAGTYPTATGVGTTPGSGTTSSDGDMNVLSSSPGPAPTSGQVLEMQYASSSAATALDSRFDLSALSATGNDVYLTFGWYDDGLAAPVGDDFNYVFLSDDSGATWFAAAYDFDEDANASNWTTAQVNLSDAFINASRTFNSDVIVRIQTGGTSTAQATLIDYVEVREIYPGVNVQGEVAEVTNFPNTPGYGEYHVALENDLKVFTFTLTPQLADQTVTDITVTNPGTMPDADITAVKLWLDVNSNREVDGSDVLLGTEIFTGGDAAFTFNPLPVNLGTTRDFVVTYSFAPGASGSFGCEISGPSGVTVSPDQTYAYESFPVGGIMGTAASPTVTLPFLEDFESPPNFNVAASGRAGSYQTASEVGGAVASANTPEDAEIGWWSTRNGINPNNSSGGMGTFEFLNGDAAAAMDFLFDLSAYTAASDDLVFRLAWVNNGLDETFAEFDHVFVSNDGGETWITSIMHLDPESPEDVWLTSFTSVSQALLDAGEDYTSNMVIRVQAASDSQFAMVDDVELFVLSPTAPEIGDPTAINLGSSSSILIAEAAGDPGSSFDEFLELTNVSSASIDMSGWTLYGWYINTSSPLTTTTIPANTIIPPGGLYIMADTTAPSSGGINVDLYFGANYGAINDTGWVLVDAAGDFVDAVFFDTIDPASITNWPFAWDPDEWVGATAPEPLTNGPSQERIGSDDHNDASDWVASTNPPDNQSMGVLNAGLVTPFTPAFPIMQFSGSHPNYTATIEQGGNLDFAVSATDINTGDTITYTVTETGGTLTAAQAGFDQVFSGGVYNDPKPAQPSPHSLELTGVADQLGDIQLQILAADSSGLTDTITIDIDVIAGTPVIRAEPLELPAMNAYGFGLPSSPEVITVQGYGLTGDLTITAPSQFEVSQTATVGYASSVVLTPVSGSVPRTDIYVRYNPSVSGPHSGVVVASGPGVATNVEIDVEGFILPQIPPALQKPTSTSDGIEILANAPENAETGSGYPINTVWEDVRMESVYLSSELSAAGLAGGAPITEVQYRVAELPGEDLKNVRIRMRHTDESTVTSYSTSGLTTVYGPADHTGDEFTQDEWFSIKFDTAFIWNGVDNVIVDFTMDSSSFSTGGGVYMRDAGTDRTLTGYDDSGSSYPFDNIANQTQLDEVPSIRIAQGLMIGGSAPNYTATGVVGDELNLEFLATDANSQEVLTFTVTEISGSASQIGFNQTFSGGVYNDPNPGVSPRTLTLDGTAAMPGTLDLEIEVTDGFFNTVITLAIEIVDPPSITTTGLPFPVFVAPTSGGPAPEQSFTVAGSDLLSDVTITMPGEFGISNTSGSGYSSSITLSPTAGSLAQTTLYVQYDPVGGNQAAAGSMVISTDRLTSVKELLFGVVGTDPVVTTLETPIPTLFAPSIGTPGDPESFTVLVANPIGPVTVTAPSEFEVSLSESSGYGDGVTVAPPSGATQLAIVVFVRYNPIGPAGTASGDINVAASSATPLNVPVEGVVGDAPDDPDGGGSSDGDSGCSTGNSSYSKWALLLGALAMLMLATRLRKARE